MRARRASAAAAPTCFGQPAPKAGAAKRDSIRGSEGRDAIAGLGGNDTLVGSRNPVPRGRLLLCAAFVASLAVVVPTPVAAQTPSVPSCFGRAPTIVGTEAADSLVGTPEADVIVGLGGNDRIEGRGGNDYVCSGAGDDIVYGGSGNDHIAAGSGLDVVGGGDGNDRIRLGANPFVPVSEDELSRELGDGGDGDDVLSGGPGNDELSGDRGADIIWGGPGDDALNGGWEGGGNDVLHGGAGSDGLAGIRGDDIGYGDAGADVWYDFETKADPGRDRFYGGEGDDRSRGGPGRDVYRGGPGADQLTGGRGNDLLDGGPDADVLLGGFGDNTLRGGHGRDWVSYGCLQWLGCLDLGSVRVDLAAHRTTGDFGVDRFASIENANGSFVDDVLLGNSRGNVLESSGGHDRIDGRGGVDTFRFQPMEVPGPHFVNLATGRARAEEIYPTARVRLTSIENAIGSDEGGPGAIDILIGDDRNNRLLGLGGDDSLQGGAGDDYLDGGDGTNTIDGGDGFDRCVRPSPPMAVNCETT
jgi:Ca2+-binding RTX toxin-like protein